MPHEPNEVKKHLPSKCMSCPNLEQCIASCNVFECSSPRYVIDAVVTTTVIEHRVLTAKCCPCGEESLKGEFPQGVSAYMQYGSQFGGLATALSTFGAVPLNRIADTLQNLFNVSIREATIFAMVGRCSSRIEKAFDTIRSKIAKSPVIHADETGIPVGGSLCWAYTASTTDCTCQTINKKSGIEGITANGSLENYSGIAVHDCWGPYFKLEGLKHSICCVHLLRELNAVIDNDNDHI